MRVVVKRTLENFQLLSRSAEETISYRGFDYPNVWTRLCYIYYPYVLNSFVNFDPQNVQLFNRHVAGCFHSDFDTISDRSSFLFSHITDCYKFVRYILGFCMR